MAFEVINLNLIPTGEPPVIHAAQYDIGRPLIINMYIGEDAWTPEDIDIELQVRKVDSNIVTVGPESVDGNTITFLTTEQMTACSGSNICVLKFSSESAGVIATLYFYLVVQRDVLQGGLTSDTAIHNLDTQIEELLPGVLGDNYYTKTEVDELIEEIPTFDPTNYYDKTETDTLLGAKADTSSLSTVATTGNYNDLSNKPTIPAAQVNSDWDAISGVAQILNKPTLSTVATSGSYNDLTDKPSIPAAQIQSDWTQSDNTKVDYIKNKPTIPTIETATIQNVAIATFPDGSDNVPVKSLEVDIEPNLSGVSSVNVVSGGDNLVTSVSTASAYDVTVSWDNDTNEIVITNDARTTNFSSGATYGVVFNNLISGHTYAYKCSIDGVGLTQTSGDASILPLTFNGSVGSVSFRITKDYDFVSEHPIGNVQRIKIALCDLTADNGTTYPISLGETLTQGGSLNVTTGLLTRTDETTSQLTPTQVKTILGNNNIFADCGNVNEVVYFKTGCESIARLIEAYM